MKPSVTKKTVREHFFSVLYRELNFIMRAKALLFCLFCYPLLVILFFTYLMNQGIIQQAPITVVDMDRTVASRSLIHDVAAKPEILIARRDDSLYAAKQALLSGEVYGILLIPNDYEKNLLASASPEVTAFYNNQYMSVGSALNKGFSQVLAAVTSNYQKDRLLAQGVAGKIAQEQLSPIKLETHAVFNPTLNYIYTLVNGVVPTLIQILIMLTMVYTMVRDKYKSGGVAVPIAMANGRFNRYLMNKMLPYIVCFFAAHLVLDAVLVLFFDLPLRGSIWILYIGTLLFIITAQLWAIFLTLWLPKRVLNYGAASSFSSPAFGFVGLFFPRIAMGWFAIAWGAILPITWYSEIRLDQTLRGHELPYNLEPLLWLVIIGVVIYLLIMLRLRMMCKRAKHV